MEKDIRLAVIGVGAMGSQHVKDIQSMSGVHLSAICDLRTERMELITSSATTKSYTNYLDMLNSMELDGVIPRRLFLPLI